MKHVARPSQSNATNTTLIVGIPPDGTRFRCHCWAPLEVTGLVVIVGITDISRAPPNVATCFAVPHNDARGYGRM